MAGVVGRGDIIDCIPANSISTFGGNPLSTTAALANLDYVLEHDLQTNSYKVGQQLRSDLERLQDEVPNIGDVRGKGLMLGIEFVRPGGMEPDAATTSRVLEEARASGLLIGKAGLYSNVLRMAPPLSVTSEDATQGAEIFGAAVRRAVAD
jgi:4-aminobutyrate aminotransferase